MRPTQVPIVSFCGFFPAQHSLLHLFWLSACAFHERSHPGLLTLCILKAHICKIAGQFRAAELLPQKLRAESQAREFKSNLPPAGVGLTGLI